jgi:PIN domain nuclease of toxin-antitoxin system
VEALIYLDTHVVVWLYARRLDLLSWAARSRLEDDQILISPMVLLEMDFLQEVGRIATRGLPIYEELHLRLGLDLCRLQFSRVIEAASSLEWTRDPFDRVIVGHASAADSDLLTRDTVIAQHYRRAVW